MLTRKEYEFMLMVYEATERMEPIRFVDDRVQIEEFREKYNTVFESLRDRWLVEGGIDNYCELWLTQKGVQALMNHDKKIEVKEKKKHGELTLILGIISIVVAIIIGILTLLK